MNSGIQWANCIDSINYRNLDSDPCVGTLDAAEESGRVDRHGFIRRPTTATEVALVAPWGGDRRDGFECAGSRDICASRKLLNIEWGPDDRETTNLTFPNPDVVTAGRQQPCDQHTVHTSKASMRSVGHQVGENQSRATITTMPAGVDGTQARRQKTEVERTRVDGIGM